MSKSSSKNFQQSIEKLRRLRDDLCSKQTTWGEAFKIRDFVVNELQDMHSKLCKTEEAPPWCKEKVEYILSEILALPNDLKNNKKEDKNV